jgi:beta-lactamase regulating signal transducer with metallopeptidase domain
MLLEIGLSNALMVVPSALLVAAVTRVCRWPALSHSLWLLVLLKLMTPPFLRVPVSWPLGSVPLSEVARVASRHEVEALLWRTKIAEKDPDGLRTAVQSAESIPASVSVAEESKLNNVELAASSFRWPDSTELLASIPPLWLEVAAALWLGSTLFWFGWATVSTRRFHRMLRFAELPPLSLQEEVRALAARLGLKSHPRILLVSGAVSPMLWAVGSSSRLLFPARLLEQLDREQRASLLVHELAHYRRCDHWVRILEMVVFGLYWWHPIVWWARREMREAEEQCCDAWVVWALEHAQRAYATALLQTVAFFSEARCTLPAAASGIGQVRHLRRRLTMIMQGRTPRSLSWTGFLAVLALGLFLLPFLPVRAQDGANGSSEQATEKQGKATDQKIAELKKLLDKLEAEKRAVENQRASDEKEQSPDVQKARAEAEDLGKQVKVAHERFQVLQQRHQEALARLAKLEGKPQPRTTYRLLDLRPVQYSAKTLYSVPETPVEKHPGGYVRKTIQGADLEKRLEMLAKEIENLGSELRESRGKTDQPRK